MQIEAATWYRDSHGLFDYEEKEKLTICKITALNNCKFIEFIDKFDTSINKFQNYIEKFSGIILTFSTYL